MCNRKKMWMKSIKSPEYGGCLPKVLSKSGQQMCGSFQEFSRFFLLIFQQDSISIELSYSHTWHDIFVLNSLRPIPRRHFIPWPRIFVLPPFFDFPHILYFSFFWFCFFWVFGLWICSNLPPTDCGEGGVGRGRPGSLGDRRCVQGRSNRREGGRRAAVLYCTASYCTASEEEAVQ